MQVAAQKKMMIGQLLLEKGVVTSEQIDLALEEQERNGRSKLLGEVMVDLGICSENQISSALAQAYGVPYAQVTPKLCDPTVVEVLPREFLEEYTVLPLFNVHGTLTVAISEPSNVFLIDEIERLSNCKVQVVCATVKDIKATLQTYMPAANVFVIDDIIEDTSLDDFSLIETVTEDIGDLEEVAGQSPVVKLVNYLIYSAVHENASDIHIETDDKQLRVRYRVDGSLYEKMKPPHQMHSAIVSRIKIMADLDIAQRRLPQDGGIHVLMEGRSIDLRVSVMPGNYGEKVVIRIIDARKMLASLESLGFSYSNLQIYKKIINQANGIVLVTGPTGSGKNTTLYAGITEINSEQINICTVEDPVECNIGGINQFQVQESAGFEFSMALRGLLRQDPDVVMIGEIRDNETATIAVQAALTGHLVMSTLHTNDACGAVTRLVDLGVAPYLVGASLIGVVAQRLVRKICPNCKEEHQVPANLRKVVEKWDAEIPIFYRGLGCRKCRNTGYLGRIAIHEMFVPDEEILDMIATEKSGKEIKEAAVTNGMLPLHCDGLEKVKAGITTLEEILRVTNVT
jgi:type IV pilus assembly protein PilB